MKKKKLIEKNNAKIHLWISSNLRDDLNKYSREYGMNRSEFARLILNTTIREINLRGVGSVRLEFVD